MKKILIIDKSAEQISELYELLDPIYDLTVSISSLEALVLIRSRSYDLIITDTILPKMNGFDLLVEIRKLDNYAMTPIIMVSDILLEEEINKAFYLGANEFITKPYHKQLLLRRIKDQLIIASTNDEIAESQVAKSEETIQNMYRMLENLCEVIESKDYSSGVHIMRSGHYYKILLTELMKDRKIRERFKGVDIDELIMASKMHDIGKIATPDNILNKPSSLTKFEFETMKNHSYNGYHILKRMSERLINKDMIEYGEQIALSHHEKWNGKGYPSHLKHEEIPLVARIMALVDVYDAITSERVYKKPLTHEKAIEIIRSESGKSFDPIVVEAFIRSQNKFLNAQMIYRSMNQEEAEEFHYESVHNMNILLIEPDPIAREIMGSQLRNSGFDITYSASGMDAIMMLKNKERQFQCVFSDIKLPDMDAFEFIRLLRNVNSDIIAFCLTGDDYKRVEREAEYLGFDGCFIKPLDCELLLYRYNHINMERKLISQSS